MDALLIPEPLLDGLVGRHIHGNEKRQTTYFFRTYEVSVGKRYSSGNDQTPFEVFYQRCCTVITEINFVRKKGELYSTILRYYFCSNIRYSDEDVIELLSGGISRRQYDREKKEAIRFMGYYFYEIVAPQIRNGRYKPSFPEKYDCGVTCPFSRFLYKCVAKRGTLTKYYQFPDVFA